MLDVSRVQKELAECNRDTAVSGVSIALHKGGSDLSHLCGTISGPVSTPYEGGTFLIDIQLPSMIPLQKQIFLGDCLCYMLCDFAGGLHLLFIAKRLGF